MGHENPHGPGTVGKDEACGRFPGGGIQPLEGFVQNQYVRIRQHRPGDGHPATHAAAVLAHGGLVPRRQPQRRQRFGNLLIRGRNRQSQIFPGGQVFHQPILLKHRGKGFRALGINRPRVRPQKPQHQLYQRGFAPARRPQNGGGFPCGKGKGAVRQNGLPLKGLAQTFNAHFPAPFPGDLPGAACIFPA